MNLTKNGQLIISTPNMKYLINNFTQTNSLADWTFGTNTFSNGIVSLTGTAPTILSSFFTVNPTDIICFEFSVSISTPSTTTSGPGLYLGTPSGSANAVYVHTFNHSTNTWSKSTSLNTNPYFLLSYNLTTNLILKNYILGTDVDLSKVPFGETTNTSYPARAIQLTGTQTTTRIRSGYNSNSSMVIDFINPKIYNITQCGFYEADEVTISRLGKEWSNNYALYEY